MHYAGCIGIGRDVPLEIKALIEPLKRGIVSSETYKLDNINNQGDQVKQDFIIRNCSPVPINHTGPADSDKIPRPEYI